MRGCFPCGKNSKKKKNERICGLWINQNPKKKSMKRPSVRKKKKVSDKFFSDRIQTPTSKSEITVDYGQQDQSQKSEEGRQNKGKQNKENEIMISPLGPEGSIELLPLPLQKIRRRYSQACINGDTDTANSLAEEYQSRKTTETTSIVEAIKVDPVEAYKLMRVILLLTRHYEKFDIQIVMDSPTTPHPLIDRLVKELNRSKHWAQETVPWWIGPTFLVCFLFPLYYIPLWASMVGEIYIRGCKGDKNDAFIKIFKIKNKVLLFGSAFLGSWIIFLPAVVYLMMEKTIDKETASIVLLPIGVLTLGTVLVIMWQYRNYEAFSSLVHRDKQWRKDGNTLGNLLTLLSSFVAIFQLSNFSAPPNIYPDDIPIEDVYAAAYFDFLPENTGENALYAKYIISLLLCHMWIALASFLVIMVKMHKGYIILYIPGLQLIVTLLCDATYILITKNLLQWISCTYTPDGPILDISSTLDEPIKCWDDIHKPIATIAIIYVVIYIVSSTVLSPFFLEDITGGTQLMFPSLYLLIKRNLNLIVVVVASFFSRQTRLIISVCLIISIIDIYLLWRLKPCPVVWLNTVHMAFRMIIIWSGGVSLVVGELPQNKTNSLYFLIMSGGDGIMFLGMLGLVIYQVGGSRSDNHSKALKRFKDLVGEFFKIYNFDFPKDDDDGIPKRMCHFCVKHTTSTKLEVTNARICDIECNEIGKALKANCTLKELRMQTNEIADQGAQALARGLKKNATLTLLDLQNNQIGDIGCTALALGLEINATLKRLRLGQNEITDLGTQNFCKSLVQNVSLIEIDLNSNKITSIGAESIFTCLTKNTTLEELDISGNLIGEEGGQQILDGLKINKSLTDLKCTSNKFSQKMEEELISIVASKKKQNFQFGALGNLHQGSILQLDKLASGGNE